MVLTLILEWYENSTRACRATTVSTVEMKPPSPSLIVFNHSTVFSCRKVTPPPSMRKRVMRA